jgi:tape measure domain-containing protein
MPTQPIGEAGILIRPITEQFEATLRRQLSASNQQISVPITADAASAIQSINRVQDLAGAPIKGSIEMDSSPAIGALDSLTDKANFVASSIQNAIGTAGVALGAALSTALYKGYQRATTIEDSTKAMTVVLGDASKAATLLDEILKVVTGTPYNLDQFAEAGKNLVAFGAAAEDVPKYLTAIGEAAAASGGSAEAVQTVVNAFGDAIALGRINNDTLTRLAIQGVPALQILANQYGVTAEEAKKMASDGLIPAIEGFEKLTDGILKGTKGAAGDTAAFAGTMEGLRTTLSGSIGGLGAAVARFGASLITPLGPPATKLINNFSKALDALGKTAKTALTNFSGGEKFKEFITSLGEADPTQIIEKLKELALVIAPLTGAIGALASTRLAGFLGPLGFLVPQIGPLVGILGGLAAVSPEVGAELAKIGATFAGTFASVLPEVVRLLKLLGPAVASSVTQLASIAGLFAKAFGGAIVGSIKAIASAAEFLERNLRLVTVAITLLVASKAVSWFTTLITSTGKLVTAAKVHATAKYAEAQAMAAMTAATKANSAAVAQHLALTAKQNPATGYGLRSITSAPAVEQGQALATARATASIAATSGTAAANVSKMSVGFAAAKTTASGIFTALGGWVTVIFAAATALTFFINKMDEAEEKANRKRANESVKKFQYSNDDITKAIPGATKAAEQRLKVTNQYLNDAMKAKEAIDRGFGDTPSTPALPSLDPLDVYNQFANIDFKKAIDKATPGLVQGSAEWNKRFREVFASDPEKFDPFAGSTRDVGGAFTSNNANLGQDSSWTQAALQVKTLGSNVKNTVDDLSKLGGVLERIPESALKRLNFTKITDAGQIKTNIADLEKLGVKGRYATKLAEYDLPTLVKIIKETGVSFDDLGNAENKAQELADVLSTKVAEQTAEFGDLNQELIDLVQSYGAAQKAADGFRDGQTIRRDMAVDSAQAQVGADTALTDFQFTDADGIANLGQMKTLIDSIDGSVRQAGASAAVYAEDMARANGITDEAAINTARLEANTKAQEFATAAWNSRLVESFTSMGKTRSEAEKMAAAITGLPFQKVIQLRVDLGDTMKRIAELELRLKNASNPTQADYYGGQLADANVTAFYQKVEASRQEALSADATNAINAATEQTRKDQENALAAQRAAEAKRIADEANRAAEAARREAEAARKEAERRRKEIDDNNRRIFQAAVDNLRGASDDLSGTLKGLSQNVQARGKELAGSITERFVSNPGISTASLIRNAGARSGALQEYTQGIAALQSKGFSSDALKSLGVSGPESIRQLRRLLSSSPEELDTLRGAIQGLYDTGQTAAYQEQAEIIGKEVYRALFDFWSKSGLPAGNTVQVTQDIGGYSGDPQALADTIVQKLGGLIGRR